MSESSKLKTERGRGPAGMDISTEIPSNGSAVETDLSAFKKKERKSYILVRIEADIVEDFREIVRIYDLESHGPLMNTVLRDFANQKLKR